MTNIRRSDRAAKSSLHLGRARFLKLSAQMRETYVQLDGTIAHTMRLAADMIDTAQDIGLEPEVGQKLFRRFNECTDQMMTSREALISTHREATRIRMRTDQAEPDEMDGCFPFRGAEEEKLRIVA